MFFLGLKGNPDFEGILDWILQTFQSRLNKNVSYAQKYWSTGVLGEEKRNSKLDKKQKIFFCKPVSQFQKLLT